MSDDMATALGIAKDVLGFFEDLKKRYLDDIMPENNGEGGHGDEVQARLDHALRGIQIWRGMKDFMDGADVLLVR